MAPVREEKTRLLSTEGRSIGTEMLLLLIAFSALQLVGDDGR
jgi:hypothetical protein